MGCAASVDAADDSAPSSPRLRRPDRIARLSVASLTLPGFDEDAISSSSVPSMEPPTSTPASDEKVCGTEIRIKWIIRKLSEVFPIAEEPQWISERLNRKNPDETESSTVIRVTFAWDSEDHRLPKSIVIKIPVNKEAREDEKGKFFYTLFKRECNAFEWLQHHENFAAPRIYHIKKHGNEEGGAAIIMEDLTDFTQQQDARTGLGTANVSDLLTQLARLHANSWREKTWTTLVADLPQSFFINEVDNFSQILEYLTAHGGDPMRIRKLEKFFTAAYLEATVNEACDELKLQKVLVHGEPFAYNIFIASDSAARHHPVAGIVDWTSCHAGCFGEDLAKAICWNLTSRERAAQTSQLLQAYHYQLVLASGNTAIAAEAVRAAYEKFVPVAAVCFVHKVMQLRDQSEPEALIERANSLINQVYNTVRITEELIDDDRKTGADWSPQQ